MEVKTQTHIVPFEDIMNSLNSTNKEKDARDEFFDYLNTDVSTDVVIVKDEEKKEEVKEEEKKEEVTKPLIKDEEVTDSIIKSVPKVEKTGDDFESEHIDTIYKELIKRDLIVGFNDDKPVTSLKDFETLLEKNREMDREKILSEEIPQFIGSLPEEVQILIKYSAEGGKDLKGTLKALADVEEFRQIEIKENDFRTQEDVAFKYLKAVKFAKGNEEKIKKQIDEWRDSNTLFEKAKDFKLELDEMHEQLVAQRIQEQEQKLKDQEQKEQALKKSIYDVIMKDNDLNGIKLDKQTQNNIYAGLTNKSWKSTEDGRQLNMLEALIEYHKIHKPNYKLLAEAMMLLSDPEDYKKKISSEIKQKLTGDTARVLRTEQARTAQSSSASEKRTVKRDQVNTRFWK